MLWPRLTRPLSDTTAEVGFAGNDVDRQLARAAAWGLLLYAWSGSAGVVAAPGREQERVGSEKEQVRLPRVRGRHAFYLDRYYTYLTKDWQARV